MAKAAIYCTTIDMAQERGYPHETAPAGPGERAEEGYGQGGGGKAGDLAGPHPQRHGTAKARSSQCLKRFRAPPGPVKMPAAALVLAACAVQAAYAHTTVEAGGYSIEAGWGTEPPVVSYRNALVFHVTEPGDSEGVSRGVPHAFRSMEASVEFGGASKQLAVSADQRPGHYFADIIPTSAGSYSVRLEGEIGGQAVDLVVPVESVEQTAVLDFPPRPPGGSDQIGPIKNALASLQREVAGSGDGGAAYDMAVFGVSLGAAGVAVAVAAMVRRR